MLKRKRVITTCSLSSCRIKAEALARVFNSRIWPCTWADRRRRAEDSSAEEDEEYFEASPLEDEIDEDRGRDSSAATAEGRAKLLQLLQQHATSSDDATEVFYDVSEHVDGGLNVREEDGFEEIQLRGGEIRENSSATTGDLVRNGDFGTMPINCVSSSGMVVKNADVIREEPRTSSFEKEVLALTWNSDPKQVEIYPKYSNGFLNEECTNNEDGVHEETENINKEMNVKEETENANKEINGHEETENIDEQTNVHEKTENINKLTNVHEETENINKQTSVHEETENINKERNVNDDIDIIYKETYIFQDIENINKEIDNSQNIENINKEIDNSQNIETINKVIDNSQNIETINKVVYNSQNTETISNETDAPQDTTDILNGSTTEETDVSVKNIEQTNLISDSKHEEEKCNAFEFEKEEILTVSIDFESCTINQTEVQADETATTVDKTNTDEKVSRNLDTPIEQEIESNSKEVENSVSIAIIKSSPPEKEEKINIYEKISKVGTDLQEYSRLHAFTATRPAISRSTSLKTGKTPPGTPSRKKIVRFADVLGLDLEDVRHIISGDLPNIPSSAFSDLVLPDEDLPTKSTPSTTTLELTGTPQGSWENISQGAVSGLNAIYPLFDIPGQQHDFIDRVRNNGICLENVIISDYNVQCTCRVMNWGFNKKVVARYSMDNWKSSHDINASYVSDSSRDGMDSFAFNIFLPQQRCKVDFALCYTVNSRDYWDNNSGKNYCLGYHSNEGIGHSPVPTSPTWIHQFW